MKLSECKVEAVKRESDALRDEATGSIDIPGIYVNDTGTTYKVVWTAIERDKWGEPRRRQRTRNFPRRSEYAPVTLPDVGKRKRPTALEAAYSFKTKMDAAARAGQTVARTDDVTVDDLFAMFMASKQRRPTTEDYYRGIYRKHVAPAFGTWLVDSLDVTAVERWHTDLEATPAAKRAATDGAGAL